VLLQGPIEYDLDNRAGSALKGEFEGLRRSELVILREQRAWCRVLEFAEDFGISASFEPFTLLERRGG